MLEVSTIKNSYSIFFSGFFQNSLLSVGFETVIIREDGTIEPTGRVIEMERLDN